MNITQIRNATLILKYAGTTFLIDPMLADKESEPGFPGTPRSHLRNPLVSLPVSVEELMNVDAIIVTHTHSDHWDEAAQNAVPKDMTIFTQNESDAALLNSQGFLNVHALDDENNIKGITLIKTDGQHGTDEAYANPEMATLLGDACGLVFSHPEEKTLYIAGDTIWVKPYEDALKKHQPDVVVLNAGFAQTDDFGPIIMGKEDILRTQQELPSAMIVASHMEAVNHCILSRAELRAFTEEKAIEKNVFIPQDGETLTFWTCIPE
ncbi:MBL fold metallo-hydrolase [Providencia stuartii]|nr:MBL fold metallo-hydrolase [Providencia sp. PROV195]MDN7222789.1 MBL fold metallo-hydrolase [Providencia stuartii]